MALGFFLGIEKGIGRFLDPDGRSVDVPVELIPKGLKPGQDFNYRSSKRGQIRIQPPADNTTRKATNSAKDRQQYAVKRLIGKGWSPAQASGIVGRFMVESFPHLDTKARGDLEIPGASVGIGQWNRERKARLLAFAKDRGKPSTDFDTQLDYFDWEIRNSPGERMALMTLEKAKTPEQAAMAMMHYERPRGYKPGAPTRGMHWDKTAKNASRVMAAYDPNYEPGTGDMAVAEAVGSQAASPGATTTDDEFGFDTVDAGGAGEEISVEDEPEEDTLGGAIGSAAEGYGAETGTVDTSDTMAILQQMMAQGAQSQQGGLPGLPSMNDLFGEA